MHKIIFFSKKPEKIKLSPVNLGRVSYAVHRCVFFIWPKIVIIFLSIRLNMCFGCSKELSHRDSSFEYPQHMF